ncbi:hypothetical protein N185_34340 [Sinorhizobium sp. GW3]|nr:hypothetical protein N185_34340 [Sinorhizobium sp. GW3]
MTAVAVNDASAKSGASLLPLQFCQSVANELKQKQAALSERLQQLEGERVDIQELIGGLCHPEL